MIGVARVLSPLIAFGVAGADDEIADW